ncbi:YppD family protein [Bacillus pumilus]|uniref:YppD family protein n=1 Tax=Bacillus pumilus TaxID=1408 RepID=UPI0021B1E55A|nr:YppD family protein [Bacillus pumilus]
MSEFVSKESILQLLEEIERKIDAVEEELSLAVNETTRLAIEEQEQMIDRLESEVKDCEGKIHAAEYQLTARPAYHAG